MSQEKGRVVKPEIPGPGGSVCCTTEPVLATLVDLGAKNKRLEAACAAKEAALRAQQEYLEHKCLSITYVCESGGACGARMALIEKADRLRDAALSPSAREQALNDFDRWQDEHMAADPGKVPACLGRGCPACKWARERLRATLRGEEEKETSRT